MVLFLLISYLILLDLASMGWSWKVINAHIEYRMIRLRHGLIEKLYIPPFHIGIILEYHGVWESYVFCSQVLA
jgi:hypothetical protein